MFDVAGYYSVNLNRCVVRVISQLGLARAIPQAVSCGHVNSVAQVPIPDYPCVTFDRRSDTEVRFPPRISVFHCQYIGVLISP